MQTLPVTELKWSRLLEVLREPVHSGLVVAFSGGVDSALLLFAAAHVRDLHGGRVVALTTASESTPEKDLQDAAVFAKQIGVKHRIERSQELQNEQYVLNDSDRCFHCKTELFRIAAGAAAEEGCAFIAYGYTASDRGDHRPGHRAAMGAGVLSPLEEAGLHKSEIRELLRQHRIELSEKPAAPCLASRIRTGLPVTEKRLRDVAALEDALSQSGMKGHRVRIHDDSLVRIECIPEQMARLVALREMIAGLAAELGYRWTVLDLAGYRTGGAHG